MAAPKRFEYRKGARMIVRFPLDASATQPKEGQAVTASGATSGYFKEVDAVAEAIVGICVGSQKVPAADGGAYVEVDISQESIYEVGSTGGTYSWANQLKTCDVGADGLKINEAGSTTDDIVIVGVSEALDSYFVRIKPVTAGIA